MIKQILLSSVLCMTMFPFMAEARGRLARRQQERLVQAIKATDLGAVRELLENPEVVTPENKEELEEQAEKMVEYWENGASIWHSPKDVLRFLGGSLLGAGGVAAMIYAYKLYAEEREKDRWNRDHSDQVALGSLGIFASLGAGSIIKRSLNATGSREWLNKAEEILDLLEKTPGYVPTK